MHKLVRSYTNTPVHARIYNYYKLHIMYLVLIGTFINREIAYEIQDFFD